MSKMLVIQEVVHSLFHSVLEVVEYGCYFVFAVLFDFDNFTAHALEAHVGITHVVLILLQFLLVLGIEVVKVDLLAATLLVALQLTRETLLLKYFLQPCQDIQCTGLPRFHSFVILNQFQIGMTVTKLLC